MWSKTVLGDYEKGEIKIYAYYDQKYKHRHFLSLNLMNYFCDSESRIGNHRVS